MISKKQPASQGCFFERQRELGNINLLTLRPLHENQLIPEDSRSRNPIGFLTRKYIPACDHSHLSLPVVQFISN